MNNKDFFLKSWNSAPTYPRNLVYLNTYKHIIDTYIERLNQEEQRLFSTESNSDVELWEYREKSTGFVSHRFNKNILLQNHLKGPRPFTQLDPQCRFVFVHAANSRARLKITRNMLMFTLTYHQVMATFIDFLFSFGKQNYPLDFHFSGLRQEVRLSTEERGLELSILGRSGLEFNMCYNLKSIEQSKNQKEWPWSMRQSAIYHSFDITTGHSFWTIVKGDELLKKRIKDSTNPESYPNLDLVSSVSSSFSTSLAAQTIIFDWCGESWRWYIRYLEEANEETTRRALLISFDRPNTQNYSPPHRSLTSPPSSTLRRTLTRIVQRTGSATGILPPPLSLDPVPPPVPNPPDYEPDPDNHETFSFHDLQRVQNYEEKVSEVLLVLESNIKILTNVKEYYADLVASPDFPQEIKIECATKITQFNKHVIRIVNDLEMQHSRATMLLSTIMTRMGLLNGILNYQSMEANKIFAEKTQASTENMEALTQKTKQETVSMRIITLVTLFYLPGTFISVSALSQYCWKAGQDPDFNGKLQTIMSTDIIQYSKDSNTGAFEEDYSSRALNLYLKITLPMMAVTFAAWYAVYWWVNKKDQVKAMIQRIDKKGIDRINMMV